MATVERLMFRALQDLNEIAPHGHYTVKEYASGWALRQADPMQGELSWYSGVDAERMEIFLRGMECAIVSQNSFFVGLQIEKAKA